jgi:hypothetical protein
VRSAKKDIPEFEQYFMKNLHIMKDNVRKPTSENFMELNWTKNSCESMNNILKLSANWKALKLPELVDKLHQIVKLQYKDMRHCVKGIIRWHHGLKNSKLVQLFGNPKQKTRKMNF